MLAACQENRKTYKAEVLPHCMMGIKFCGDLVIFYEMRPSESYLASIDSGFPVDDFVVNTSNALCLSNAIERERILCHLWSLRKQAILLPIDDIKLPVMK